MFGVDDVTVNKGGFSSAPEQRKRLQQVSLMQLKTGCCRWTRGQADRWTGFQESCSDPAQEKPSWLKPATGSWAGLLFSSLRPVGPCSRSSRLGCSRLKKWKRSPILAGLVSAS